VTRNLVVFQFRYSYVFYLAAIEVAFVAVKFCSRRSKRHPLAVSCYEPQSFCGVARFSAIGPWCDASEHDRSPAAGQG